MRPSRGSGSGSTVPALLHAWPAGKVTGIRACDGFIVDIQWQDHKVIDYRIRAKSLHGRSSSKWKIQDGDGLEIMKHGTNSVGIWLGLGLCYARKGTGYMLIRIVHKVTMQHLQ